MTFRSGENNFGDPERFGMLSLSIAQDVCSAPGMTQMAQAPASSAVVKFVGDEAIVLVQGASDSISWMGKHRFMPRYVDGLGLMHSAIGAEGMELWDDLRNLLVGYRLVTFAGHGAGAALAQVMLACYRLEGPERLARVVGFGSPRVTFITNYKFRKLLRTSFNSVLYARWGDPVVGVPMSPYRHALPPVMIETDEENDFVSTAHSMDRYCEDMRVMQDRELLASLAQGKPGRNGPDEIYGVKNAAG